MEQFKRVFIEMVRMVLQNPPTEGQQTVVGLVALLVGAFVFLRVCEKFDIPNVGLLTGFLYAVFGAAVILGAMAAGRIYLAEWRQSMGNVVFYSAIALTVKVVLFVPLLNAFIQGKYMGTLSAWLIGAATALTVVALGNTLFDMGRSGQRVLNKGAERNATTKEMTR